ncbi:hypothetical protein ACFLIM_26245 [Nonomuraea sp. M3C6]|uniref:PIN domain-containing protein n=1 Tax=Nonomuraea marmarensis TaxID=3351344 RepID=A0ABW7AHW9_9ACTN
MAINLIASQEFDGIAAANDLTFVMVSEAAQEVSALRSTVDGERVVVPVSLAEHVRTGRLEITELAHDELALFVKYAAEVDDGEAATIAVAAARSMPLATDDKKAHRLCISTGLPQPVRTSALLRAYTERAGRTPKEISRLLRAIDEQASFVPPRVDPEQKWWMEHLSLDPRREFC